MWSWGHGLLPLAIMLALCAPRSAAAAEAALRIETGMHTERVFGVAADRAGRYLVTGAGDKTVRVWDLQGGALLRTLRIPGRPAAEHSDHLTPEIT